MLLLRTVTVSIRTPGEGEFTMGGLPHFCCQACKGAANVGGRRLF
jgi:hypothetical protein